MDRLPAQHRRRRFMGRCGDKASIQAAWRWESGPLHRARASLWALPLGRRAAGRWQSATAEKALWLPCGRPARLLSHQARYMPTCGLTSAAARWEQRKWCLRGGGGGAWLDGGAITGWILAPDVAAWQQCLQLPCGMNVFAYIVGHCNTSACHGADGFIFTLLKTEDGKYARTSILRLRYYRSV